MLFRSAAALLSLRVCVHRCLHVCVLCINGHVGISDRSSDVSWDLEMKREGDEEKSYEMKENPLIILVFSCVVLFYHILPPFCVCVCVCVRLHQSPTITQQSFPLSHLYHSYIILHHLPRHLPLFSVCQTAVASVSSALKKKVSLVVSATILKVRLISLQMSTILYHEAQQNCNYPSPIRCPCSSRCSLSSSHSINLHMTHIKHVNHKLILF